MRQSLAPVWLAAVLSFTLVAGEARAAPPQVLTGALDGAEYKIEVPTSCNGTLLLYIAMAMSRRGPVILHKTPRLLLVMPKRCWPTATL